MSPLILECAKAYIRHILQNLASFHSKWIGQIAYLQNSYLETLLYTHIYTCIVVHVLNYRQGALGSIDETLSAMSGLQMHLVNITPQPTLALIEGREDETTAVGCKPQDIMYTIQTA